MDDRPDPTTAVTWHHGVIARWWANFNVDGPEIAFFRSYVAAGQPALDVGCGTGRLLVPWVLDGLDVDGVDASADMIEACRVAARNVGREPALYVQAIHQLDLARRYRTIVCCGAFGLGASRAADLEGLRRLHAHLAPGGVLALDCEVGGFDDDRWRAWRPRPADGSPPPPEDRRAGPDGFHYALRHRIAAVDRAERSVTRELQAWQWQGDELVAHETHALVANTYSSDEIVTLLGSVGFSEVRSLGGYHGGEPTEADRFHVFVATRPG
ncbi:MAG: class I SAM-dependent methyltransferase [Acidimicrobiia bacterium]|nr:class I SAM-dependent methyltransferase [Acidimicrobiia bacterium]